MNVKTTISISEARRKIFDIAKEVQKPNTYYEFTINGEPRLVIMSKEEFDSIMETMEILGNPEVLEDIKKAEEEYKKGRYVTWDKVKKELGLGKTADFLVRDKSKKKYRASGGSKNKKSRK